MAILGRYTMHLTVPAGEGTAQPEHQHNPSLAKEFNSIHIISINIISNSIISIIIFYLTGLSTQFLLPKLYLNQTILGTHVRLK